MSKIDDKQLAHAVGRSIAAQRIRCGLTQEAVADKLDIGYEAVSRIERGVVMPNIARLVEFAEIFGCATADLLMETSPRPVDQANRIAQLLAPLTPSDREWIVKVIEDLSARLKP